jgi:hypothetical protein
MSLRGSRAGIRHASSSWPAALGLATRRPIAVAVRRLLAITLWLGSLSTEPNAQSGNEPITVEPGDSRVSVATLASVRELAGKGLEKLAPDFPGTPLRRIRVVVHTDQASLSLAMREHLHEGTAGFALLGRDEVHILLDMALSVPPNDLRTVLEHELVHVLLDQFAASGAPHVPRWVHEGLAQTLSGGPYLGVQEEGLLFAISARTAPRFSQLEAGFPDSDHSLRLAYAQSLSFVSFLTDRFGVRTLVEAARDCRADRAFDLALLDATDESLARLQEEWENYVLFRSGAAARFLMRNCFSFLIVLAAPLLILAVLKRLRLNRQRKAQLAAAERVITVLPSEPE